MLTSQTREVTLLVFACLLAAGQTRSRLLFESEQRLQQPGEDDDKVWLFAVDGLKRPYAFVNDEGALVGFDVEVISSVCQVANKQCRMVLAEFTECTFTHRNLNYPGRGLMSGWFDACPGYAITVDRQSGFDFTDPYLTTVATFTVAPGNPSGFDPQQADLSTYTLAHLTGAPTNAACLRRLNKKFGTILIARDLPEARELLLNGTAQAVFSPRTKIDGLDVLPDRFHCDEGGAGVMVKKGSPLPAWWNPAFQIFYRSGRYNVLCKDASLRFSYTIKCLPRPSTTLPVVEDD
ncbi:L-arginine-binding protein-like [Babylonia areolata]|uniref:L-arginine-binding protein-like n=1 Tax=Babylonia areolata TaxID=304850 RepID=UPI003FCF3EB2